VLVAALGLPSGARGQALLREYLARAVAERAAPPSSLLARLELRAARRVDRRSHPSEQERVERLADGRVLAVYTRSQLRPGSLDRFELFAVRGEQLRAISPEEAYRSVARGLSYPELAARWRQTVERICTVAYARAPRTRVQVETELRFLERELERRARQSGAVLPWRVSGDAREALEALDPSGRVRARLGRSAVGEGTLAMLARGDYSVHAIRAMPREEFRQLLRWARADPAGYPYLAGATLRDWPSLARRNSKLARAIATDVDGLQFGGQRSASIAEGLGPRATAAVVAHELNHGANRIPAKDRYGRRETLAFELAAAVAQRRAAGERVDRRTIQRLKRQLVESYGLGSLSPESVADRPHGPPDNWVPRFPRGEERRYLARYFAR
jgi:hypothetical protein